MGFCFSSSPLSGNLKPWERDTEEIRTLAGGQINPHKVALICQAARRPFVDLSFPPSAKSAGKGYEASEWARPTDIFPLDGKQGGRAVLFDADITPDDVQQGSLGDCWFICTLAIVAQYPAMIRRICPVQFSDMEQGVFRLRLCRNGWWEWITIDSYFPVDGALTGRPTLKFGSNKVATEFWVAVLEKAYARIYGSYESIVGGWPPDAVEDLTGCQSHTISCDKLAAAELHRTLAAAFERQCLVTTYTKGKDTSDYVKGNHSNEEQQYAAYCKGLGIVPGHAYSVLGVGEFHGTQLIKCRNPWGGGEWKGAFSDGSREMTEECRQHLRHNNVGGGAAPAAATASAAKDDGTFWMPLAEFQKLFPEICICEFRMDGTEHDWTDIRMRGTIVSKQPSFYAKVHVRHDTDIEVFCYNQRIRRDDAEMAKKKTSVRAHLYASTDDGRTFRPLEYSDKERHSYKLKASSTPYLVVPCDGNLTDAHNMQEFTVLINSAERTTKVETYVLSEGMHKLVCRREEISDQSVQRASSRSAVPMQRNGLLPPTVNWANDLIMLPKGKDDCLACCGSLLLPCCMNATLRTKYDNSNCLLNAMCVTTPLMRNIVREGYSIEGSCMGDLCAGAICYPFALMQVWRELRSAGRLAQVAHMTTTAGDFYTTCYSVDHCGKDCLLSCLCPCVSNALSRHRYDGSNVLFNFLCLFGPVARNIVREGYHLDGSCVGDIICATCFAPCAANQLRQEVDVRGPKALQDVQQLVPPTGSGAPIS